MRRDHSEKMADLAQREEEAKKQVSLSPLSITSTKISTHTKVATWEQMYKEWMATMERRVNNLQVTNEELQVDNRFERKIFFIHQIF